ncbi:hypothetical protein KC336_g19437 [Hortaea werneckii]|nr:hypothetical protein KC336_g19437 [Hortaea werneckii]
MTDTSGGSPHSISPITHDNDGGGPHSGVVDDSVSLVTHESDDHKSFPFFDLPPELRNRIYSFSVKDTGPFDCYGIYILKLLQYFQPSLQRVSKQFRHEYEKEVLKSATISSINYSDYTLSGLRWIHKRIGKCVKVFPSVVTIILRIDLLAYRYDDLIDGEYVTTEDLFRLPSVDGGRVKVQVELFLHSRLFKALNPNQNSDEEADQVFWNTPVVIFRASPSAGSYSYKGLDLEVESVGLFEESFDLCGMDGEDYEWEEMYRL